MSAMFRPSESYKTTSARESRSSVESGRFSNVGFSPVPIICTIEEKEERSVNEEVVVDVVDVAILFFGEELSGESAGGRAFARSLIIVASSSIARRSNDDDSSFVVPFSANVVPLFWTRSRASNSRHYSLHVCLPIVARSDDDDMVSSSSP